VGQKEFFIYTIYYISLIPSLGRIAHNVPAVTDIQNIAGNYYIILQ
jgi:hypothetical protein